MENTQHTKIIGKHVFNVLCDVEKILDRIEYLRGEYDEGYVEYYTTDDEGYLTPDDYSRNLDDLEHELYRKLETENLEYIIEKADKKKNGTFNKGRVYDEYVLKNTHYFTDWHNTWAANVLRFKVIDDLTIELDLVESNITPG